MDIDWLYAHLRAMDTNMLVLCGCVIAMVLLYIAVRVRECGRKVDWFLDNVDRFVAIPAEAGGPSESLPAQRCASSALCPPLTATVRCDDLTCCGGFHNELGKLLAEQGIYYYTSRELDQLRGMKKPVEVDIVVEITFCGSRVSVFLEWAPILKELESQMIMAPVDFEFRRGLGDHVSQRSLARELESRLRAHWPTVRPEYLKLCQAP